MTHKFAVTLGAMGGLLYGFAFAPDPGIWKTLILGITGGIIAFGLYPLGRKFK